LPLPEARKSTWDIGVRIDTACAKTIKQLCGQTPDFHCTFIWIALDQLDRLGPAAFADDKDIS
jgi:hypothetical protein